MSVNVLTDIVATTRDAVSARGAQTPLAELVAAAAARQDFRGFREALAAPGLAVIAEHKRSSPSAGVIRSDLKLADVVRAYERAGAAALSVLTEESRFDGKLADLAVARAATSLPILRKDFIVEPYQLYEAAAAGADAVLLIVAAMETGPLAELHALAGQLGLATLVEVHDLAELEVALTLGAQVIGINNRNLATLEVNLETSYELLPAIPAGTLKIAESGFRTRAQLERLATAGVDGVLIGESLMRSADIEAACRELTGVLGSRG